MITPDCWNHTAHPPQALWFASLPVPSMVFLGEWQEYIRGVFIIGLRNGNYYVVSCQAFMSLMFVVEVMSLLGIAVIAGFVLVEKVAPAGHWVSRISGFLLVLWGSWMLLVGGNELIPTSW